MRANIDRQPDAAPRALRPTLCGEELPKAGHICAFFDSRAEKYEVLAPFFNDAIRSGDRLINAVEAANRDEHVRGMTAAGVDMEAAIASGQVQLSTCEDLYYRDGRLDPDAVLDMLRDALVSARAEGSSVRACGEMNWVARDPSLRQRAMEYEARVNEILPGTDCTMMCVYDLAHTPSTLLADILATHPYAVIKGRLRANPWAVDPQEYLDMHKAQSFSPE